MKKNYIILLLSLTLTFSINAQNLILNPGFENHSLSDGCYTNESAALGGFWFGLDDFSLELNSVLSVIDVTNENVKLYPNPSNLGFIGVNGIKSMQDYIIYNSLGKETIKGKISENERIDIKNLTNGLYFLKFENRISLKFIKE